RLGAFFIYSVNSQSPLVFLPCRQQENPDGSKVAETIMADGLKIYRTHDGNYNVVVASNVSATSLDGALHFYQLEKSGVVREKTQIISAPCKLSVCNDALSYPMVAVDDIDGDGFKEVVVMAKAKVMVF